jgi:8-oxo-dGTP diphosphatase
MVRNASLSNEIQKIVKEDFMEGISVIIKKDGKYLLLQQAKTKPFPLKWLAVSGKMKDEETSEQAAIREAREETGLVIEIIDKAITLPADYGTENVTFFLANWKSGEVKTDPKEINDFGWFKPEEILKLDLMNATRIFFEKHFKPF